MTPLDEQALAGCVRTATLAPSLHNSQPWRFRIDGGTVEVFADRSRQLEVLDPSGRELLISVGAAVFTLRLAIGMQGRIPEVTIFPDPARPDLVARIRAGQVTTPSAQVNALAAAIGSRHTNRLPFANAVVPADSMEHLCAAAAREGATLTRAGAVSRDTIIGLARTAEARLRGRGGYRAELGRWTRPRSYRQDGIPHTAYGPWDALEHLPLRDFGLVHPQPQRPSARFEAHPTIVVLATDDDTPADWVRAGQALQRVLLTATHHHLATTPISQPVEIPAVRDLLTDPATGRTAQIIIRLGYAAPAAATPRRPLTDILESGQP
ncbi:Acg family FMN-binding oxidoreductase [Actinoplanes xinjiangensis]|uniref:Nitroreductase family protein n=1 Tax=Actinoplanes xinjiangensis TaxID=512350 RepID=A0A316EH29_9ACTN|nr:nitroreductase family protein [Actinoplanes xinjiangensis]PWK30441.1 nitroreductase family protein [Actinoplanes xinjiangensis]